MYEFKLSSFCKLAGKKNPWGVKVLEIYCISEIWYIEIWYHSVQKIHQLAKIFTRRKKTKRKNEEIVEFFMELSQLSARKRFEWSDMVSGRLRLSIILWCVPIRIRELAPIIEKKTEKKKIKKTVSIIKVDVAGVRFYSSGNCCSKLKMISNKESVWYSSKRISSSNFYWEILLLSKKFENANN